MFSSKATTRAARAVRSSAAQTATKRAAPRRAYATQQEAAAPSGGMGQAVTGGLIGGSAVFFASYLYYRQSGAKAVVDTTQQAKSYADSASEQLKQQIQQMTPDKDDVVSQIRSVADRYAAWIPGGKEFVDRSFKDVEDIRKKHGKEFDEIARATYDELREAADKKGTSLDILNDIWQILSKRLSQLSGLAGDAAQQILDNHPEAKEKLGGSFDQLKDLGDRLGPEAKKQVEDTFKEASKIASAGFSADAATRIYKLVQDKKQQLQKLGDQSWQSGLEQIKPLLEKNETVKKLFEENIDTLKSGHVTDVLDKVRTAVQSGSTGGLENYIKE